MFHSVIWWKCPWWCSCIGQAYAGTVSRRRPNTLLDRRRRLIEGAHGGTNHVYYCIYSMYSVTEGERVSRSDHWITKNPSSPGCCSSLPMSFLFGRSSLLSTLRNSSVQEAAKDISLRSWTMMNDIRRCLDFL